MSYIAIDQVLGKDFNLNYIFCVFGNFNLVIYNILKIYK